MNKLPFRVKLITSIAILFLLFVIPSRMTFQNFVEHKKIYKQQLTALAYSHYIQSVLHSLQVHRGLVNGYLHGNDAFEAEILANEAVTAKSLHELIAFDRNRLGILKTDKHFVDVLNQYESVKFYSVQGDVQHDAVFQHHSRMIASLIKVFQQISTVSFFESSDDLRIHYIAKMLEDKLLELQENTAQLRGLAVGYLATQGLTKEQKSHLLSLYIRVKTLEEILVDNHELSHVTLYNTIVQETTRASRQINHILQIVNEHLIVSDTPSYDATQFFREASSALEIQAVLYKILSHTYRLLVEKKQQDNVKQLGFTLLGFAVILLVAFYVFMALYRSVVSSLFKLQVASRKIAKGRTNIRVEAQADDELGDVIVAFNHMSERLNKNISFLNGYKMAIDESSIVSKTDIKGKITFVNKKFCELSGYTEAELLGKPHSIIRHPEMPKELFQELWQTIKSKKIWHGIVKNRTKSGDFYIVDATILPIVDNNDQVVEYVAVRHDITELEKSKEEILRQKIDLLTGLPNRSQLLDDLKTAEKPILLYLNIDDFSSLNDFYGAGMADSILQQLAGLLNNIAADTGCKAYRLHGDEFLLYFEEGFLSVSNYHEQIDAMMNDIENTIADCDTHNCASLTLSAGVALYTSSTIHEKLLQYAGMAYKEAKAGHKKFLVYHESMQKADYENNIQWIQKIKDAIAQDRIVTFYQPIIDNRTGTISKYEALVRMIDANGKIISPFFFLEIAKKAKLYTQITKIVIDKAFAMFESLEAYAFSINITIEDINDEEIAQYIFDKLERYAHCHRVVFEITETEEIENYFFVNKFIKTIKSFGAKVAIDDFGTGYANFEHIISLDVDFIKIDGSLIRNIDTNKESQAIAEAIIAFSQKLGSKTVVEFVHNEAVYEKVKLMGADYSQGYYLGEPSAIIAQEDDQSAI